jgi:hypothetical protein
MIDARRPLGHAAAAVPEEQLGSILIWKSQVREVDSCAGRMDGMPSMVRAFIVHAKFQLRA